MVSANPTRKAAMKKLASIQTVSAGRRSKNNRLGSKARNSAPILAPNIPARDQVSRGDQPLGEAPRVATTSPENPASATAISRTALTNPPLAIVLQAVEAFLSERCVSRRCEDESRIGH